MSGIAPGGFPVGDVEKDFMLVLIRPCAVLYLVEVSGFCFIRLNSSKKNVGHVFPAE
jgi:hypothetical protein